MQMEIRKSKNNKIGLHMFEILKVLGQGSYAKVCLVRHLQNKKLYAMKSIRKDRIKKKKHENHI